MVRIKEAKKGSNTIYDDTVVKYTLNIPIGLYNKITANAHRQHLNRSVVIRSILEKVFHTERPISMKELLEREAAATEVIYVDRGGR